MKLIIAYVPFGCLTRISTELEKQHICDMSVSMAHGFGREREGLQGARWEFADIDRTKRLRVELACHDTDVDGILATIYAVANPGLRGNGFVFVLPIVDALRLMTGERGIAALGQPNGADVAHQA